jgi:hypothetical protein
MVSPGIPRMVARCFFHTPEPELLYQHHNYNGRRDRDERAQHPEGRSRESYGSYHNYRVQ